MQTLPVYLCVFAAIMGSLAAIDAVKKRKEN